MATWDISALRTILSTETDADSPVSEELMSQFRENWEALVLLLLGTGITGTVTSITETVLTDTAQSYDADTHINHTLLITSGDAIGNMYTIDDNDATTLTCTGDTMVTDGVEVGDTFAILYDMKVNQDGHDHDGDNSKEAVFSKGRVVAFSALYPTKEYTNTGTSWTTVATLGLYVPATANKLYAEYSLKAESLTTASVRINETTAGNSSGLATASTSYTWVSEDSLDMSGVSEGWTTVNIQLRNSGGSGTSYLDGLTLVWGP